MPSLAIESVLFCPRPRVSRSRVLCAVILMSADPWIGSSRQNTGSKIILSQRDVHTHRARFSCSFTFIYLM